MNQTPTLEFFAKEFTEEFIEEFRDDTKHNRRLELFKKINGQSSTTSTPRQSIYRNREAGHQRLVNDYFSLNPVYPENIFRRRFRMGRHAFLRIVDVVSNFDPYFQQRIDVVGRKGLSPLKKCTAAMRMLAYGVSANAVDDYVRIGENTAVECLKKFVSAVYAIFEVASSDLWIWHAFFGVVGSNNDINVLDRSPVFDDVLQGRAPEHEFVDNDRGVRGSDQIGFGVKVEPNREEWF
ncbi:uncharacterized protein LOC141695274 [Apium graveolens]|uniref:uncharacterized protein LOC141695274 n=1 Tax=Apium graveolens TaxID=4045 RepID=UPI003D7A20CF